MNGKTITAFLICILCASISFAQDSTKVVQLSKEEIRETLRIVDGFRLTGDQSEILAPVRLKLRTALPDSAKYLMLEKQDAQIIQQILAQHFNLVSAIHKKIGTAFAPPNGKK